MSCAGASYAQNMQKRLLCADSVKKICVMVALNNQMKVRAHIAEKSGEKLTQFKTESLKSSETSLVT